MISLALVLLTYPETTHADSLTGRLGFSPTSKIVIIHADDMGLVHSANQASIDTMAYGLIRSGSVMMPCGSTQEVSDYFKKNPQADIGVHTTLTSEWDHYRWGPLSPPLSVRSLVDYDHFFYDDILPLVFNAQGEDTEQELEAQVQAALNLGIHPTHLDTHMGAVFVKEDLFYAYLRVALKYHLPPMFPKWTQDLKEQYGLISGVLDILGADKMLAHAEKLGFLPVDHLILPLEESSFEKRKLIYENILRNLKNGVTLIITHPAYADGEFKEKIISSDENTIVRDYDAEIFQDRDTNGNPLPVKTMKNLVESLDIHLIGWKEIQKIYPWDKIRTHAWPHLAD